MMENKEVWEKKNEMVVFFRNLGNNGRLFSSFNFVLSERGFVTFWSGALYSNGCIYRRDIGKSYFTKGPSEEESW